MDEAGVVYRLQRFGRLTHQRKPIAVELRAAADNQRVQARPVEELHHDELLVVCRYSVAVRHDNPRMLKLGSDFAFGGLIQSFETGLQLVSLPLVKNLQANDLLG